MLVLNGYVFFWKWVLNRKWILIHADVNALRASKISTLQEISADSNSELFITSKDVVLTNCRLVKVLLLELEPFSAFRRVIRVVGFALVAFVWVGKVLFIHLGTVTKGIAFEANVR